MTSGTTPWTARYADIQRLLAVTGASLEHMAFGRAETDWPLVYEAAYFARCQRLVVGMAALIDQDMPDLSAVLLRPMLECWLRGLWLHKDGSAAYAKLLAVTEASMEQWNKRSSTGQWVEQLEYISARELGALKLVKELAPMIGGDQRSISGGPALLEAYYMMYGTESERDIHHGLEGVDGHIDSSGAGPLRITPVRSEPWDARNHLAWCAHLLIEFARFLYPRFALPTAPLDALATLRPEALLADWRPRPPTRRDTTSEPEE